MKINVLVVQLEAIAGDIIANIKKVEALLENSKVKTADLIVLPELWTTGWDCPNFPKYAEEVYSSQTYKFLQKIARKYKTNVVGGSAILYKQGEKNKNTSLIFNRDGELNSTYEKFHLFSHRGQSEGNFLEEGATPVIAKLDIGKIGISTCYDIRFPEMFRLYAFNDVDLMVNMAAWPKNFMNEYEVLAKARAIENQTIFISSMLTGKINEDFNFTGNSAIYNYNGKEIAKLSEEETVLKVELTLDEMLEYRKQMPMLKDTKKAYQILER